MDPRLQALRPKYSDGLLDRAVEAVVRHRFRRIGDLAVLRGYLSADQLEELFGDRSAAGVVRESPPLDELMLGRRWITPEALAELKEELDVLDFARVSTAAPSGPPPEVLYVLADPDRNFYHFVLVTEVSGGDTGKVWKAWDCNTQRWVQLKVLSPTLPAAVRLEFLREAEILRSITSRHLVTVLESGEFKGQPYLATELVEGRPLDLNDRLQSTITLLAAAADALHLAHQKGAVHRRLHPGCLVGSGPVVVDFGAPHFVSADKGDRGRLEAARFVAPEIASGNLGAVSPATDVYGLGLMLWEAIERRPAFPGDNLASIYQKILARDPAPPRAPKALRAVCMKAIARDSRRRFSSAGDFAAALRKAGGETEVTRVRRIPRKFPWRGFVGSILILAAAAAGGGWYVQWERVERDRQERMGKVRVAADAARRAVEPLKAGAPSPDQVREARGALEALGRIAGECGLAGDPAALVAAAVGWYWAGDRDRAASILSGSGLDGSLWPEAAWIRTVLAVENAALARAAGASLENFDVGPDIEQAVVNAVRAAREIPSAWAASAPGAATLVGTLAALHEKDLERALRIAEGEGAGPETLLLAAVMKSGAQIAPCDGALQRRPGYAPALALKAQFEVVAGDLEAAESSARAAVTAAPGISEARVVLGSILRIRGRPSEALEEFGAAIRAEGTPFTAYIARGDLHRATSRWDEAIRDYADALKLKPTRPEVRLRTALAWQGKGDLPRALEVLDRMIASGPQFAPALVVRGTMLQERGELDKALADLDRAVAMDPAAGAARLERARVRRRLRRDREALEDLEELRRLDPNLADIPYEMAKIKEAAGDSSGTIPLYDEALRLRPGWPEALASRGLTHYIREDFEAALADLQAALQSAPSTWTRRSAIEGFRDNCLKKLGR